MVGGALRIVDSIINSKQIQIFTKINDLLNTKNNTLNDNIASLFGKNIFSYFGSVVLTENS